MKIILYALSICLYGINTVVAVPQRIRQQTTTVQPAPDIQRAIEEVFSTPSSATPPNNRGFDKIVTPEPNFVPTTAPQTLVTNGEQCTCVPYHRCDPTNNSVKDTLANDAAIGFGLIDIRFDPEDCQDVLDVCCRGVDQRQETIVPPPIENKPTRASGCGIRIVGGLDFKITGAFVSC